MEKIQVSIDNFIREQNDQTAIEAATWVKENRKVSVIAALQKSLNGFHNAYTRSEGKRGDIPGLILANQGETIEDFLAKLPEPTFEPDDDNVIPISF